MVLLMTGGGPSGMMYAAIFEEFEESMAMNCETAHRLFGRIPKNKLS
jgi:hypothetical protein